jgi:methionyl-tRNA formyltransferase
MESETAENGLRIVFMGTPSFAVGCLDALLRSRHDVVAVVTAPDRPAGRGRKPRPSEVKKHATENAIPVLQPEKLKNSEFLEELQSFKADLFVVVAFRMLPKEVWSMPELGTFNLHASLLPDYRGAAPIQWAIWNGDTETGVSTFFINEKIDTGSILLQERCAIGTHENAGELHDRLMKIGADLVVRTADGLEKQTLVAIPQNEEGLQRPAPKIFSEDTYLDPRKSARELFNQVRALSPYPGARLSLINEKGLETEWKILKADYSSERFGVQNQITTNGKKLFLGCNEGSLELLEVQAQGKKAMLTTDFLNGFQKSIDFQVIYK